MIATTCKGSIPLRNDQIRFLLTQRLYEVPPYTDVENRVALRTTAFCRLPSGRKPSDCTGDRHADDRRSRDGQYDSNVYEFDAIFRSRV